LLKIAGLFFVSLSKTVFDLFLSISKITDNEQLGIVSLSIVWANSLPITPQPIIAISLFNIKWIG
jgi:hypothetical protein